MCQVQFTLSSTMVLVLLASPLLADEPVAKPPAQPLQPLQVLEDCAQAIETGDFGRYVDHLSKDEQRQQAGYILYVSRLNLDAHEQSSQMFDPQLYLLAHALTDLFTTHRASNGRQVTSQPPAARPSYNGPPSPGQMMAQYSRTAEVLGDARKFLVDALAEISRPTDVTGETTAPSHALVGMVATIPSVKDLKWTVYTRGDHAVALAPQPVTPGSGSADYQPLAISPSLQRPYIEFQRSDGHWKITRILQSAIIKPMHGVAHTHPYPYPATAHR